MLPKRRTYEVTLILNNGTQAKTIRVNKNSKIRRPDLGTIWYRDRSMTVYWNFESDIVKNNMILYS